MTDSDFEKLTLLYGFAPSRALRELVEAVERMEREECAKVCDARYWGADHYATGPAEAKGCAAAIRARKENT